MPDRRPKITIGEKQSHSYRLFRRRICYPRPWIYDIGSPNIENRYETYCRVPDGIMYPATPFFRLLTDIGKLAGAV